MLAPCPACRRHIRSTETTCPFCDATTTDAFRAQVSPRRPIARLGRAALFTVATTGAIAAAVACSSDDDKKSSTTDAGNDAGADAKIDPDGAVLQPAYGGPPVPLDASSD